jgi:hypothetical protein
MENQDLDQPQHNLPGPSDGFKMTIHTLNSVGFEVKAAIP